MEDAIIQLSGLPGEVRGQGRLFQADHTIIWKLI